MQYLTFSEYTELGGSVTDETTFNSLQRSIESTMNYLTFGRVDKVAPTDPELMDVVKGLEVDLINKFSTDSVDVARTGVKAYSNGIESYTFDLSSEEAEKQRNKQIYTSMQSYLWKYPELFYRGLR